MTNLSAAAGTNLTVTATAGGVSGTATVGVVAIQQSLSIQTDQAQIPSDASKPANISAILLDANNNAQAGVTVKFSATSGVLAVTQAVTDVNGIAKATLTAGTDPSNRAITVTATAGAATANVIVAVSGTTLTLTGPTNLVLNNSGSCGVVLANSAGQGIAGATVTLASANGNTLSAATLTTDNNGRGTFTLTGTKGGADTITATGLGLTQTISVAVSTQSFNITAPANNTNVNLGTAQMVTVTWLNNGAPVVGQPVTFAATRGVLAPTTPVMTDANGHAVVSISSTGAGPSIVQATATGVTAEVDLDFVALVPSQISVQAGPAAVAVGGQSTISALVRDAANNLVEGATVNFQVVTDPTNGQLSVASATTDAQGRALTVYTAGNTSSGANGVTVTATVAATSITGQASLTVGGQAVFLSMGTGNSIDVSQGVAIYQVTYTVLAVDSQGAALANVPITVSVLPVAYGKGAMTCATTWFPVYSTATADPDSYNGEKLCLNEDTDYTGNINSLGGPIPPSTCAVKDYNCNGKLDPGNVAVASPSSGNTDSNGRLDIKVTYPRDHANWVQVTLVAATTVQGTQSSTRATFLLVGAASDYASCNIGPPGPVSPYGTGTTCANPL
ncbi:MAG TPA: Ig-like domain-containing protein [Steroidobacteraceae bacterium]|nr:Ig-like domain-containing protein [Steroidobacteraceae bacterium]